MKPLLLAILISVGLTQTPMPIGFGPLCLGAHMAIAAQSNGQERQTPDGEWCQRPPLRSNKAHECHCHQHDCTKPQDDANSYSAHTDQRCLNYCTIHKCMCEKQDCP
jgi:hypothetical protein